MDAAWKSAVKYVAVVTQQEIREAYQRHRRQKEQNDHDEYLASELAKIEQKTPMTISKLSLLNDEGKLHYARGQITSLSTRHKRVRGWSRKCLRCLDEKSEPFVYPVRMDEYIEFVRGTRNMCDVINGMSVNKSGECGGQLVMSPIYVSVIDIEAS